MKRDIEVDDRVLAGLTLLEPDLQRTERTRQRCRALLEGRAADAVSSKRPVNHRRFPSMVSTALRNAIIAACAILCVAYVVALVLTTAGLRRLP
jgi:hypothetical protein